MMRIVYGGLTLFLILALLLWFFGCAKKGLVTEEFPPDFYRVPDKTQDIDVGENPTFIVYGDNRPGWRAQEKFVHHRNWKTWKMLIFPFYQLYWLGNGIVGGVNRLRAVPDYGASERRMVRDAMLAVVERSDVDFIINTGDMPYDGRYPHHWGAFLQENKVERDLLTALPFLPVIGNHEHANDPRYGSRNFQAIFDTPPFYVLDFPDVALFVIDSNLILDQYEDIDRSKQEALFREWFVSGNPQQPAWLERELGERTQRFKIVAMHHPPISFGKHHIDWREPNWGGNLQQKRRELLRLLGQNGVQLVVCGHEHYYEHSFLPDSKLHIVVSGGGGVPLRDLPSQPKIQQMLNTYRSEGLTAQLVKQAQEYHYCLITVDGAKLVIRALAVSRNEPARLIEEFAITGEDRD